MNRKFDVNDSMNDATQTIYTGIYYNINRTSEDVIFNNLFVNTNIMPTFLIDDIPSDWMELDDMLFNILHGELFKMNLNNGDMNFIKMKRKR